MTLPTINWSELSLQIMIAFGHFLWQGCATGLVLAILLAIVDRRFLLKWEPTAGSATPNRLHHSASAAYLMSCVAFFALPVCVIITLAWVHQSRGHVIFSTTNSGAFQSLAANVRETIPLPASSHELVTSATQLPVESPISHKESIVNSAQSDELPTPESHWSNWREKAHGWAPFVLITYLAGVGLMFTRLGMSIVGGERLCCAVQPVTDTRLLKIVAEQSARIGLMRTPLIALCQRVSVPAVVGLFKPIILMPPALLSGLDVQQLSAILSHELAHIRRYDLVVNLAQRIVEALLFFHPVTWWISRRIRRERENCCDDTAALGTGHLEYAGALLRMAELCIGRNRVQWNALASLSVDGGNASDFALRVRRLIVAEETTPIRCSRRGLAIGGALLSLLVLSLFVWGESQLPQSQNSDSPSRDLLPDDGIHWSTTGGRDGLLSGARLILPEGGLKPGQPLVVEYRLKNVSSERKSIQCFLNKGMQFPSLSRGNRISGFGLDRDDIPVTLSIDPGKVFINTDHLVSFDTTGLEPGAYQVVLSSAFQYTDPAHRDMTVGIPHRGTIPFTMVGSPITKPHELTSHGIQWGQAVAGLRLGAKFVGDPSTIAIGQTVEADLFVANATDQPLSFSVILPHPHDGWLFNVEDNVGQTIMLERPIPISVIFPQQYLRFRLAPGEHTRITGDGLPVSHSDSPTEKSSPGSLPRAKFQVVGSKEEASAPFDVYGADRIQGRLISQGGNYSAIFETTLVRPEIPGLRLEVDSGNVQFAVSQVDQDPNAPRVLDDATEKSIHWGESVGGMRLGIRLGQFAKQRTPLRHGEHIEYEVWIKNETDEVVRIARDPRDLHRPRQMNDQSINVVGGSMWMSFGVPTEILAKAELVLPPGHSARRFLAPYHSTSIREPGSPRGRFGPDPLLLEPGRYPVFAQVGDLKSGVEEVDILPAARLQIRKAGQVTDKKRENAAQDPSEAILSWMTGDGVTHEAMVNWDHGVMADERDLASAEIVIEESQLDRTSIQVKLRPESATRLTRQVKSYSLWDDPDLVAVLLDGKPIATVHLSSIADGKLDIAGPYFKKEAEELVGKLRSLKNANFVITGDLKATVAKPAKGTGSVSGRISVEGGTIKLAKIKVPGPKSPPLSMRATEQERRAFEQSLTEIEDESLEVDTNGGLANAFVYLIKPPMDWKADAVTDVQVTDKARTVELLDYSFTPRSVVIRTNQDLQLNNRQISADAFRFEPLNNAGQNRLIKPKSDLVLNLPFPQRERIPVQATSNIHPWKKSYLLPLDHPFAAITDRQGQFSIDGLPPGEHTFVIWHERAGWLEKTLSIKIQAGQSTRVDREYKLEQLKVRDGRTSQPTLQNAAEAIRGLARDPIEPMAKEQEVAYDLLVASTENEAANRLALELANYQLAETSDLPVTVRLFGIKILNNREQASTLDFLRSERKSASPEQTSRLDQLIRSVELGMFRKPVSRPVPETPKPPENRILVATFFGDSIYRDTLDGNVATRSNQPRRSDADLSKDLGKRLLEMVVRRLTDDYRSREKLVIKDEWIVALKKVVWRQVQATADESKVTHLEEERFLMSYAWQHASMQDWLLTKSLYEKYGGRVGMGSLGLWLAPDGRNALIHEAIAAGSLEFRDAKIEKAFWEEANKPNFADAYPKGEDLKRLMSEPPQLGSF